MRQRGCRKLRNGDGAGERSSKRSDGDLGGDAALARTRVLRPASGGADCGRFRRVCRNGVPALLRAEDGCAVGAAGALLPHAHGRLFRGDLQRARDRLAVFGFDVAARFSAAGEPGEGSRSLVVVEDARAAPARDPRDGLRLGVEAGGRARSGQGQADWHQRVDDGGQCRAAHDRAPGRWPDLSRNADADSQGERHRDAKCGRSRPYRPHRKGKKLSNEEWISRTDPEAKIAKLKDGRTHLAYKPEHAVDLDTGVMSRRRSIPPITGTPRLSRARWRRRRTTWRRSMPHQRRITRAN